MVNVIMLTMLQYNEYNAAVSVLWQDLNLIFLFIYLFVCLKLVTRTYFNVSKDKSDHLCWKLSSSSSSFIIPMLNSNGIKITIFTLFTKLLLSLGGISLV